MFAIFSLLVCFAAVLPINILAAPPGPRLNIKRYLTAAGPSESEPLPPYSPFAPLLSDTDPRYWPHNRIPLPNSFFRSAPSGVSLNEFFTQPEDKRIRGEIPEVNVKVGDIISMSELPGAPPKDPGQTSWRLIVGTVDTTADGNNPHTCFIFKPVKKRKIFGIPFRKEKVLEGWKRDKDLFPRPRDHPDVFPGYPVDVYLKQAWTVKRDAQLIHGRAKKSAIVAIIGEILYIEEHWQTPSYSATVDPPAYGAAYSQSTNQRSSAVHPSSPSK